MPAATAAPPLPLGLRYSDAPEGEIRDEANRPFMHKYADLVGQILGLPGPEAPREAWIAPTIGLGLTYAPALKAAATGAKHIYQGAVLGSDPTNIESASHAMYARRPPNPPPVVERLARRFVDPDDEKLYQIFLQRAKDEARGDIQFVPEPGAGMQTDRRSLYGAGLDEVLDTRMKLRGAQAKGRWHDFNRSSPYSRDQLFGGPDAPGDPPAYLDPPGREQAPEFRNWRPADSPQLTRMDHAMQAMKDYYRGTPLPSQLLRVLAYNAAKGSAQGVEKVAPSYAPAFEQWLLRHVEKAADMGSEAGSLLQATPPSFKSMLWGLRPFWARD